MTALAVPERLWPWSLFAALIAMAGLPIYIHAPKFYVDAYGVSLASLGGVLAALRLFDVVQDPVLGWLAERGRARRGFWVALAAVAMAVAMVGLFAAEPPVAPMLWFALMLAVLFTAFSFLTIVFYAEGVGRALRMGAGGHVRLAGWREAGSLVGVCIAAVAPVALGAVTERPFAGFAAGFAVLALVAVLAMRREWSGGGDAPDNPFALFRPVLGDALARRLLLLALVNAAPVAVTSTLFLFFVESRLGVPEAAGPLLLLFFLAAALSTPLWTRAAQVYGEKRVLLAGMGLAVLAFLWAAMLGSGDLAAFSVICVASGAALGADMVLLPAIFARRLGQFGAGESAAFSLWAFVSKLSLALAAAVLLPALQAAGFVSGGENGEGALRALSLAYAVLPCGLKLLAIGLLFFSNVSEE